MLAIVAGTLQILKLVLLSKGKSHPVVQIEIMAIDNILEILPPEFGYDYLVAFSNTQTTFSVPFKGPRKCISLQ